MKRKMSFSILLSLFLLLVFMQVTQNLSKAQNNTNKIPDDAIRLRIIANSNSAADQAVKRKIRDAVNANVEKWVQELKSSEQAKRVINAHLDDIRPFSLTQSHYKGFIFPGWIDITTVHFCWKIRLS